MAKKKKPTGRTKKPAARPRKKAAPKPSPKTKKPVKPRKPNLTEARILSAIPGTGGVATALAKKLRVDRRTIFNWRKKSDAVTTAMREEESVTSDDAETGLIKAVRKGSPWAIKYWLSTKGKGRGYTTKHELAGNVETTGQIHVYLPQNGRETDAEQESHEADEE